MDVLQVGLSVRKTQSLSGIELSIHALLMTFIRLPSELLPFKDSKVFQSR